jgi:signal transduction histidine kinase
LARLAWLLTTLAAWGIFSAGLPLTYEDIRDHYRTNFGIWRTGRNQAGEITLNPAYGEPAARAGLLERDVLVSVDGLPVDGAESAGLEELIPPGEAGSTVSLVVRTGDNPQRQVELIRGGDEGAILARLGFSAGFMAAYAIGIELLTTLLFTAVALFIFWRRSSDGMALLVSVTLIQIFVGTLSPSLIPYLYNEQPQWQPFFDAWISLAALLLFLTYYLFPTGRFQPRMASILAVLLLIWAVTAWFLPDLYFWRFFPRGVSIAIILCLTGIFAQLYRYTRASDATQRQQTKWIVYGTTFTMLGLIGRYVLPEMVDIGQPYFDLMFAPITRVLQLFLPLTLAFAIFRYRLWDIDLVLNRTLVYSSLTIIVAILYIVAVGTLGNLLQAQGNLTISLFATGLVAVIFQPMRRRLQGGVNRLMYGERDDPVGVMAQLGEQLENTASPDAILPNLVKTVTQALKLPYAAIALDGKIVTAHGQPVSDTESWSLTYQAETIGQLIVAHRTPGEPFNPADRLLLANIVHQAGAAAHAVGLTAALRRSRSQIVSAREEERRRIRRDLHDGLGPQLASQTLGIDAVIKLMDRDPEAARTLLQELKAQTGDAIKDIRRLVYDLRPPALDELGLMGALRQGAAHYQESDLAVVFQAPTSLPPLSAAIEVAAYRIIQEALTNVARHAGAKSTTVILDGAGDCLYVEVVDNGRGLPPDYESGVGMQSMRERAEELNGRCIISSQEGGPTRVQAWLPLLQDAS